MLAFLVENSLALLLGMGLCVQAYRMAYSKQLLSLLFNFLFAVCVLVVVQLSIGADVAAFTLLLVTASGLVVLIALGLNKSTEQGTEFVANVAPWKLLFSAFPIALGFLWAYSQVGSQTPKIKHLSKPMNPLLEVGSTMVNNHLLVFELAALVLTGILIIVVHLLSIDTSASTENKD